jgi:Transcriptional regulators
MRDDLQRSSSPRFVAVQAGKPGNGQRSDDVAAAIRGLIVAGRLRQGHPVPSERDLAAQFGVSRQTVREAIRQLGSEGLLDVRQGRRSCVSRPSSDDLGRHIDLVIALDPPKLRELVEWRHLVEPGVAALAAEHATEEQRAGLANCVQEGTKALKNNNAMIAHDSEFHRLISVASHNQFVVSTMGNLAQVTSSARATTVHFPRNNDKTITEHTAIMKAIVAGDIDGARRAMDQHLRRVLRQVEEKFPRHQDERR